MDRTGNFNNTTGATRPQSVPKERAVPARFGSVSKERPQQMTSNSGGGANAELVDKI